MQNSSPWNDQVDVILSDESSSSDDDGSGSRSNHLPRNINSTIDQPATETDSEVVQLPKNINSTIDQPAEEIDSEGAVFRRAQMYQDYMKQIPVPTHRGSVIPFDSWTGLAKSIKQLYGQPLHYLTNLQIKQWDKMRFGAQNEDIPLDILIHPCKAEANIWLIEEVHRLTTSHHHLAKLWLSDPMPHGFIDPIFPKL